MTTPDERDPALVAIGAYLRRRARLEGVTDEQAAKAIGKGTATVTRLYAGTIESGMLGAFRLLRLVRGSPEHILTLLDDPRIELALELAELPPVQLNTHDPLVVAARMLAEETKRDPGLMDAIEGFIAGRRSVRSTTRE